MDQTEIEGSREERLTLVREGWVRNCLYDVIVWAHDFNTLTTRLEILFQKLTESVAKLNYLSVHLVKLK